MSWKQVTKEEFDKILAEQPFLKQNTVGFCDPPIRFYWNKQSKPLDDWSFGKESFAKVVLDYDIVCQPPPGESGPVEILEKPEFYILEDK